MRKKAFVVGANKEQLRYAKSDAEKIAKALEKQGYVVAPLEVSSYNVRDFTSYFKEFVDDLKKDDQLIFFFAGHSFLKGRDNKLYFALESSNLKKYRVTCVPASEISSPIEQCEAKNKLIILDSCSAAAFSSSAVKNLRKVNYAFIYSTEAWEKAHELDVIQGGVLTHLINIALSGKDKKALNSSYELTFHTLAEWLLEKKKTEEYKNNSPWKVESLGIDSFVIASFKEDITFIDVKEQEYKRDRRKESKQKVSPEESCIFTDSRDGKIYPTINVNGVTWLAKDFSFNLRVQKSSKPKKPTKQAQLLMYYSFEEAISACPDGWRLPDEKEWKQLIQCFKGFNGLDENRKTIIQRAPKVSLHTFNLELTGCFIAEELCINQKISSFYWTSTQIDDNYCQIIRFDMPDNIWSVDMGNKNWKISSRYIKAR